MDFFFVLQTLQGCPGLLPYDKDRDLFDTATEKDLNVGTRGQCTSPDLTGGYEAGAVCPTAGTDTCAACCTDCDLYDGLQSISQDKVDYPACCTETEPDDSCPKDDGIDPKNNVMAYIPDFCS